MKSPLRLTLSALIGFLALIQAGQQASAQRTAPFTVTRLFTGPDGQTHAEDIEWKLTSRTQLQSQSDVFKTVSARVVVAGPGWSDDWHNVGQRQFLITISGRGEMEVADGRKIPMVPGRILLVEDTTGKGHKTWTIGDQPRVSVNVPLAEK